MKLFIFITAALLMVAGCSSSTAPVIVQDTSNHHLEYQYLGELPSYYEGKYHAKYPCKLYLLTHTSMDSVQGITVRRRYVTVCSVEETATLTEYDIKIR